MLLLLLAFGLCSLRKGVFVQFTADVLVLGVSLCQAFALKLASLIPCLCSLHERSLAALLLDLVALKLLGQKQGFITRLLVAWRGLCLEAFRTPDEPEIRRNNGPVCMSRKLVINMSFRQVPSRRQRSFQLRQRRDRTFFEALEGCAEKERLTVRPVFTYSPPVVAVRFGHLYQGSTDQRGIESLVWKSIVTQLPRQLVAMDSQRLGTPTAAYDLHFQQRFLQQKHELLSKTTIL